ncbi:Uncharacterised protein [Bordetella pertussis]|nr:Uncharacterised protein [Bordetella pertussis]CFN17796.1 Uncharacterised protein [Bordetella pertussis]CFP51085.1 Uncharacterised protein [Bordetella pertussis]CPJ89755.1 Uncharacterised protein [Bordetella pertussis]CPL44410.1 Uncharacterised protein [Bordetella pertussis]
MADEKHGQAQLFLQILEQIQNLRLDRHVQRRGRFVADQEARPGGQRARDADALALAAGEFVRIALRGGCAQADHVEQVGHHAAGLRLAFSQAVKADRLGHDFLHPHARVERRIGILEHHLDLAPERVHPLLVLQAGQVDAVKEHAPVRGRVQAGDQAGHGGFARTRLPHQPEHFALVDRQVDLLDRVQRAPVARQEGVAQHEAHAQVFHFHQRPCGAPGELAPLAQPVGGDVQFHGRALDVLDIGHHGEAPQLDVGARHGGDQAARVGVVRVAEYLGGGPLFDQLAAVQYGHAVGDVGDHAHVVRDDDHPDLFLPAQLAQQVEDLRLDRHVQRGGRLVGDDDFRPARQRQGDHHPLPHAARELVRILLDPQFRLVDADLAQQFDGALAVKIQ